MLRAVATFVYMLNIRTGFGLIKQFVSRQKSSPQAPFRLVDGAFWRTWSSALERSQIGHFSALNVDESAEKQRSLKA